MKTESVIIELTQKKEHAFRHALTCIVFIITAWAITSLANTNSAHR